MVLGKAVIEVWDCAGKFISIAGLIVTIIGVLVTLCGVYYGKRAYEVATDIFNKGIQLDKEKVLKETGLDFVLGFIIPFSQFRKAVSPIWDSKSSEKTNPKPTTIDDKADSTNGVLHLSVRYVCEMLKSNEFHANTPYYKQSKGDVWNALEGNDDTQAAAFAAITKFEEEVEAFTKSVRFMIGYLEGYIKEEEGIHANDNVEQLFANRSDSKDKFEKAEILFEEVESCIQGLPKELNIEAIKERLS